MGVWFVYILNFYLNMTIYIWYYSVDRASASKVFSVICISVWVGLWPQGLLYVVSIIIFLIINGILTLSKKRIERYESKLFSLCQFWRLYPSKQAILFIFYLHFYPMHFLDHNIFIRTYHLVSEPVDHARWDQNIQTRG